MGLDSVEIVMGWEETFGISIGDQEAGALRTPRQAIDLVSGQLATLDGLQQTCLTLRAFLQLRRAIVSAAGISRSRVRPGVRLKDFVCVNRRRTWELVRSTCGWSSLPNLSWFSKHTVEDVVRWAVA